MILETGEKEKFTNKKINKLTKGFVLLLLLQIIYGAFTAGLKAGYLFPTGKDIFESLFTNFAPVSLQNLDVINNPYNIQFLHRMISHGLFSFYAIFIWQKAKTY